MKALHFSEQDLMVPHMTTAKYNWLELTPQEFRERIADAPIAYLPMGTLEWHGEHLPLGTDALQPIHLFGKLAELNGGVVMPTMFVGPDIAHAHNGEWYYGMDNGDKRPAHLSYPRQQLAGSAYWTSDDVFQPLMDSILTQVHRAGIRILVAHGHGPSTGYLIRKREHWEKEYGLKIFHCWEWEDSGADKELSFQTGHAGINETSLILAIRPDLVQRERLGDDREQFPIGVGPDDPRDASSVLGEKIITYQVERMSTILQKALAHTNND